MLQCVRAGEVFCGLHVAHVRIICPVRDVTHVRKYTRPFPALLYCKRREAGRGGLGTRPMLTRLEAVLDRIAPIRTYWEWRMLTGEAFK